MMSEYVLTDFQNVQLRERGFILSWLKKGRATNGGCDKEMGVNERAIRCIERVVARI